MKKLILLHLFFLIASTLYSQSFINIWKTDKELIKLDIHGLIIKPNLGRSISFSQGGHIQNIDLTQINKIFFGSSTTDNTSVLDVESIQLYPNPAHNLLFFKGNTTSAFTITIFNLVGLKVIEVFRNLSTPLDISEIAPGFYFVRINGQTLKFQKQL